MSLKLYRPSREGLEPDPVERQDWRGRLLSRRWRPAAVENPEVDKPSPVITALVIAGLAGMTFLILVAGYLIGLWP